MTGIGPPPARGRPGSAKRQVGFTLIEVVVAFTLLAVVFAAGFEIFSTGMSRAADLELDAQALGIAQSRLAAAGTEELLKEGEARGETDDHRFRWATTITRSDEIDHAKQLTGPYVLYRVQTRVDWRTETGRDRDITLATLVLGSRQ